MLSKKYLIGAMILLFLVVGLFSGVRMAKAQNVIKIGIFGPKSLGAAIGYPHWVAGMWTAAEMLKEQINAAGGWNIGGTTYTLEMYYADEYTQDYTQVNIIKGQVDYLCKPPPDGVGVNFIIGGFRTECVQTAIDYWYEAGYSEHVPWFINGASTSELLSDRVGVDHEGYRHLYRIMPTNSTALFATFTAAVKTYLCSDKGILTTLFGKELVPGQPKKVRTAIIMEDLTWTNKMWELLVLNATTSAYYLGPHVYVDPDATTRLKDIYDPQYNPKQVEDALTTAKDKGCNLILHVFSGGTGKVFIQYYSTVKPPALLLGINVVSQTKSMWDTTSGACEYESHLMAMGTRSPITPELEKFWDDFLAWSKAHGLGEDNWPVYTAVGVANGLITIKTAAQGVGSKDNIEAIHNYLCPVVNSTAQPIKVLNGYAKFTNEHDVYNSIYDYTANWTGNARSWAVQWLDGRLELVYPSKFLVNGSNIPFVKIWCLPPWMYTLIWDITYDGYVGIADILLAADNFGSIPGDARWDHKSDVTGDNYVGIADILAIADHFGGLWTPPDP